ncbi:MAG: ABC transporter permease, partial [Alphaproteobacteria bacterium]|nr:ABC transporter permease [Alphaproteobacteria bacterium]
MRGVLRTIGRNVDPIALAVLGFNAILLFAGSLYSVNFLSADYLLQQVNVASFLGVIASGAMLVILLGQIDLSIPWVVTVGGMMSTAAAGWGPVGNALVIPFGIACGIAFGLFNGVGVAYLRVPSMIFTLSTNAIAQGLMIVRTGGFAPQDQATGAMHWIAVERSIFGIPNAVWVWAAVALAVAFMLNRTVLGRRIYAIGNRERAVYLSGVETRRIVLACFAISGACSAFAGVLLAGYAT